MLNVIPRFIQEKLEEAAPGQRGQFAAACLFVDIAGFTAITEKLMSQGKKGAEDLSVLINKVYRPLIETVHRYGGFIAVFAGDSITALFPGNSGDSALQAAQSINEHFLRRSSYYLRYSLGEGIRVRAGLASGDVSWVIFGKQRKAYCFYGDPVVKCAEVVKGTVPGSIAKHMSFSLTTANMTDSVSAAGSTRIKPTAAAQFVPVQVLSADRSGEFRDAVSVFISFRWTADPVELQRMMNHILLAAEEFGGYWNGMFFDDKGPHALVVFGAPVSYENNTGRAADFVTRLLKSHGNLVRSGISGGMVFAGTVGTNRRCTYTVLGDKVNLAARMMQMSDWGQVLVTSDIASSVRKNYRGNEAGSLVIGEKSEPIKLFVLEQINDPSDNEFFPGKMIGRESELARLREYCKPVFNGHFGGLVHVRGTAGIGKSRLIHELLNHLPHGTQTFIMQTDQVLRKGFNPFVYFLSRYFAQTDTGGRWAKRQFNDAWNRLIDRLKSLPEREKTAPVISELIRTRSLLEALLGIYEKDTLYDSLDARGRFENTQFALKELIKGLSLIAPTVLVLEDIHWVDSESAALLGSLTRNTEGYPFVIVASSRPGDHGSSVEINPDLDAKTVDLILEPLPEVSEMSMIETLLSGEPSRKLASFILHRSQGNPFYVEQFCMYLIENKLLARRNDQYHLAEDSVEIPGGINAIIVARIDRLSRRLKKLVQTASILGREFDVQILSAVLRGDIDRLNPLLKEGESETIWTAVNEIRYIFRHSILRDAVYRMQMQKRLQKLHRLAAEATENLFGKEKGRYSEIAYHHEMAGDSDGAVKFLKLAAEFARDEYRNEEALNLYRRLLSLCSTVKEEIETEIEIANILVEKGERDEAQRIILSNMKKAEEADSQDLAALCYRNMAKLCHRQGSNTNAMEYLDKAYDIFSKLGNQWEMASTLNILGNVNTILGNYDDALENFSASNKAAESSGDKITLALNISNVGNIHLYRYELDQAEEYYNIAIEECKRINEKKALANSLNNLAVVNYYRQNYKRSQELLDEFVEISTEIGNKEGLAYIFGNIGILHQELGDYTKSLEYHERQLSLARELGDLYNITKAIHQIGQLQKIQGDFKAAENSMTEAIRLCGETGDVRNSAQCHRDLGTVHLDSGDYSRASDEFSTAYDLGKTGSDLEVCASSRLYMARLAERIPDRRTAQKYAEEAVEIKTEMNEPLSLLQTLIGAAELFLSIGEPDAAGKILSQAEAMHELGEAEDLHRRFRFAEAKHKAVENPGEAADRLLSLLSDSSGSEELTAEIHSELYSLTGEKEHRTAAREQYSILLRKAPRMKFREKLEELSETDPS